MLRVFLSVPIWDRSEEQINSSIKYMTDFIKKEYPNDELEFVSSYDTYPICEPSIKHKRIYYIGQSLISLSTADIFVGVDLKGEFMCYYNCYVEESAAMNYKIKKIYRLDIHELCPDLFKNEV